MTKDKVTTRWLVEQELAKKAANEVFGTFTAQQLADEIRRDVGGVRAALKDLAARGNLRAGERRGTFTLAGAPEPERPKRKGGAMAARIEAILALLAEHPDGLTRAQLAEALGDGAGDVAPGKSGSTTLWTLGKRDDVERAGRTWRLVAP